MEVAGLPGFAVQAEVEQRVRALEEFLGWLDHSGEQIGRECGRPCPPDDSVLQVVRALAVREIGEWRQHGRALRAVPSERSAPPKRGVMARLVFLPSPEPASPLAASTQGRGRGSRGGRTGGGRRRRSSGSSAGADKQEGPAKRPRAGQSMQPEAVVSPRAGGGTPQPAANTPRRSHSSQGAGGRDADSGGRGTVGNGPSEGHSPSRSSGKTQGRSPSCSSGETQGRSPSRSSSHGGSPSRRTSSTGGGKVCSSEGGSAGGDAERGRGRERAVAARTPSPASPSTSGGRSGGEAALALAREHPLLLEPGLRLAFGSAVVNIHQAEGRLYATVSTDSVVPWTVVSRRRRRPSAQ